MSDEAINRVAQVVAERMGVAAEHLTPIVQQMQHEVVVSSIVMGLMWLILGGFVTWVFWYVLMLTYRAVCAEAIPKNEDTSYVLMALFFVCGAVSAGFTSWNVASNLRAFCAPSITLFDRLMTVCR